MRPDQGCSRLRALWCQQLLQGSVVVVMLSHCNVGCNADITNVNPL